MSKLLKLILLVLVFCSNSAVANVNNEFPARKLFPAVPHIEIDDLHKQIKQVIVVDVRSEYEFETLRIKGGDQYSAVIIDLCRRHEEAACREPDCGHCDQLQW